MTDTAPPRWSAAARAVSEVAVIIPDHARSGSWRDLAAALIQTAKKNIAARSERGRGSSADVLVGDLTPGYRDSRRKL
jgi:hypothetical protein